MRQSYRIIPIYTADVSGVCSALYELGGMTVMHDPSGCNSTYNTHDEIRWYDQDSLIYISGLNEIDAIMGNDEKFIRDIEDAARALKPKFIALAGSPIPFMNGTDFPALAEMLEEDMNIPAFSVPTNGMHDYVYGAGMALAEIAEHFTNPESRCTNPRSLNLLGVTPLDFGPLSHVQAMKQGLEQAGWKVLSTWAMGDDLETLARAGEAAVNLVVSSVGLRSAEVLKRKFGTPYVVGAPVGKFTEKLVNILEQTVENKEDTVAYLSDRLTGEPEITLIGEPVMMGSLAVVIEMQTKRPVQVLCPLRETEGLLAANDAAVRGEEELEERLKGAKNIVADPLYRPICPPESRLYELPHIAFSGRIYLKKLPVFAELFFLLT
ncbi:MAG: nitrogenase component 1 [Anaerovoracaceae bacterium]